MAESDLWDAQRATAEVALSFTIDFLGCQQGASNDEDLDANATGRLMKIIRAVSWVESKHGTVGPARNHPKEDPFQSGNPGDSWWKELTGQSGNGSRFIRKPGTPGGNLWANQVQATAEAADGFPAAASFNTLTDKTDGHNDPGFVPSHSYTWGIIYLVHKINTNAGARSYQCGDLARTRLIKGAVEYNGHGVDDYEQRIIDALALIGDIPPPLVAPRIRKRKKVAKSKEQVSTRRKRPATRSHAKKKKAKARTPTKKKKAKARAPGKSRGRK